MITRWTVGILSVLMLAFLVFGSTSLFEHIDANEILLVQSPVKGVVTAHTTPGIKWQGFGRVVVLLKRTQFWFSAAVDQGKKEDESLRIRFNDNAHAKISGSISWELPLSYDYLRRLFDKYGTQNAIEQQLVRTVIEKAVYMTGPMMSSRESAAERRNELLQVIEDQIENGVYLTQTVAEKSKDPLTGQDRIVNVVKVVKDEKGRSIRSAVSPLKDFGIRTFNLAINEITYDKEVEDQIKQQQRAIMQVQIAIAKAKEAEQETITVTEKGKANAATAKWEQEKEKAKAVVIAEQLREVTRLNSEAAEFYRIEQLKRAEGDATYRAKVMAADGALKLKLEAWLEAQKLYAGAIQNYQGQWVPTIQMGGNGGSSGGAATDLINLLTARTAKELGLDMGMRQPRERRQAEETTQTKSTAEKSASKNQPKKTKKDGK